MARQERRLLGASRQGWTLDAAFLMALTSAGIRRYVCVEMLYFAYGCNLNLAHLAAYLASHAIHPSDVENPRRAILRDHRLRTNYLSCVHSAGACNIEPSPGHAVEGLVMNITEAVRSALRVKEGWPRHYQEVRVEVIIPPAKTSVNAFTYVVNPTRRLNRDQPVSPEYRRLILEGAKVAGLSAPYQALLRRALKPLPANEVLFDQSIESATT